MNSEQFQNFDISVTVATRPSIFSTASTEISASEMRSATWEGLLVVIVPKQSCVFVAGKGIYVSGAWASHYRKAKIE